MTEQERPRTEAGRSIIGGDFRGNEAYTITREGILAIEAEGRQQARDIIANFSMFGKPDHGHRFDVCRGCLLDELGVAGLNASESPPTDPRDYATHPFGDASESGQPMTGAES